MKLPVEINTYDKALAYLMAFELDGEKIGFLRDPETKEDVRLQDAPPHAVISAARYLYRVIYEKKKTANH